MTYISNKEYLIEVSRGNVSGASIVQKFGSNEGVSTSWEVVSSNGLYEMPTTAQSLEFVSSSAADALNGVGAHELTIIGLNASWEEQTVVMATHATDGTTAVAITGTWTRVYRAYVSSSGTYATATSGSHVGTIDIQGSGGGTVYAQIGLISTFPAGQTAISAYTIPSGKTGYFLGKTISPEANKPTSVNLFIRENADDVTTSFGAMRIIELVYGLEAPFVHSSVAPLAKLPAKTDLGFLAKVATGTGQISIDFEILLIDN